MFPAPRSNRWYVLGVVHGLALSAVFLVPLLLRNPGEMPPEGYPVVAVPFIVFALLLALAGRAGKLIPWLLAVATSVVATGIWAWRLSLATWLESVGILVAGLALVPLATVLSLAAGYLAQRYAGKNAKKA